MYKCLTFIGILLATQNIYADNSPISTAQSIALSQHNTWHKLLHYNEDSSTTTGLSSAINSENFFNSPTGKFDANAELEATLEAFLDTPGPDTETHAQCLFPARFLWIKEFLKTSTPTFPKVTCKRFSEWTLNNTTKSLSVIFATGYLGNPASYYGHTLLKFNSSDENKYTNLLDVSVNYGAILPDNESPIPYILKGLFGGYDGGFSHVQFYFHNHNYGENELRNLWEYELELSPKEVDLIVAHTWELLGKKYTYYFLKENCAFRMAELLELIDGIDIIPKNPLWTIPQSLIQNLGSAKVNGKPLIRKVSLHPSRQARLYQKYSSLHANEQKIIHKIVSDDTTLEGDEFTSTPLDSQRLIIDTLLDYYQFIRDKEAKDKDTANAHYQKTLSKRFQLPAGKSQIRPINYKPPHKGRSPSLIRLGALYNSQFNSGASLTIRPTYYDSLDSENGHVKDALLTMAELKLIVRNDRLMLRSFDLAAIESVNAAVTGLPGDSGKAWKLKLSVEQQNLGCDDCLVAKVQGEIGHTFKINKQAISGAYLGGALQEDRNDDGPVYAKASAFTNIHINDNSSIRATAEYRRLMDGDKKNQQVYTFETRHRLSKNLDIRFLYEKNVSSEAAVSLGYYW